MTDLAQVEADVREAAAQMASARDPAPTAEEQLGTEADRLIDRITEHAIAELRAHRDGIDDQIRAMQAERDQLKTNVRRQIDNASRAISVVDISRDAVAKITSDIEHGLPAPVARVITARKGNGRTV